MHPQQPEQGINPVDQPGQGTSPVPPDQGINPVTPPAQGINPVPPRQPGSTGETEAPPPRAGRSKTAIAAWIGGAVIVLVAIIALIAH